MIDLSPSSEELAFADAVVAVLNDLAPLESLATDASSGPADLGALWNTWADLGWLRSGVAEDAGGLGATLVEEVLVYREFGRHLMSTSLLATGIAAQIAGEAGKPGRSEQFMNGSAYAAFGLPLGGEAPDRRAPSEILLIDAMPGADVLLLNGDSAILIDGTELPSGRRRGIDARAFLTQTRVTPAVPAVESQSAFLLRRARTLLSAQLCAAAEESLRLAVDYAKMREQFGRPIGAFQSIAHQCADMAGRARIAWAQTRFACLAVMDDRADADLQLESALLVASSAADQNTATAVRVHGGLGFTTGCAVHHYLKRAILLRELAGSTRRIEAKLLTEGPAL
ncbi:MAG: acyl-CoA dehydrogenase family protein [Burkholderiaceae bacterium]